MINTKTTRANRLARRAAERSRDALYAQFADWGVEGILGLVQVARDGAFDADTAKVAEIVDGRWDRVEELLEHDLSLEMAL